MKTIMINKYNELKSFFGNEMKNLIILLLAICLTTFIALGQKKGAFTENIQVKGKNIILYYYVPENYNSSKEFPLIVGLPYNPTMGNVASEQVSPVAKDLGAIFVLPDYADGWIDWSNDLVRAAVDHAKDNYSIDLKKIVLTGYVHGAKFIFKWGYENIKEIAGMIGYAPDLSNMYIENELIKMVPIGLIVGSMDPWKDYADQTAELYNNNGGKCRYIIPEGIDQTGPYFTSESFKKDWSECYNYIINNSPSDVRDHAGKESMRILPNVILDRAVIILKGLAGDLRITLLDYLGNEIEALMSCFNNGDTLELQINKGNKKPGVYFVKAETGNGTRIEKIVLTDR